MNKEEAGRACSWMYDAIDNLINAKTYTADDPELRAKLEEIIRQCENVKMTFNAARLSRFCDDKS